MQSIVEKLAQAQRLQQAGRLNEAEQLCREVLAHDPAHADAVLLLGLLTSALGRADEAIEHFRTAARLRPDDAAVHHCLGSALAARGQFDDALASLERAAQLAPDSAPTADGLRRVRAARECARGHALAKAGNPAEAEQCFREALRLEPNYMEAMVALAAALTELGRYEESEICCRRAAEILPNVAQLHYNLAIPLVKQNRLDEALDCYRRAIALAPDEPEYHVRYALTLLLSGQLAEGSREMQWRWKQPGRRPLSSPAPHWNGEPLSGKSILLAAEQGHGDTLQLVRYAELLKERGAHTIVESQPPLVALLRRCRGVDLVVARGEPLPAHDFVVPLLSLPAIFNTALADVPANVPYVSAEPALVAHWRQRFADDPRLRVGIAWQGSPTYPSDRERSFPLSHLKSVADLPNVRLFSLQWGLGREQLAAPPMAGRVVDLGDELGDFHTTAAIVSNLDLVISCDSAPNHLAGALGVRAWLPLTYSPDWRWTVQGETSPWYPTVRLFRQRRNGEWPEVFERITAALAELSR